MDKINDEVEKLREQKHELHKVLEGGIQSNLPSDLLQQEEANTKG